MRKISVWFGRIIGIIAVIISVGYEIFAFFDDFYLNFIWIGCIERFLYGLFDPLAKIYISNGSIFIDSHDIYYQIFPQFLFLSLCNVIAIIFCFIELIKFVGFLFRKWKGESFMKVIIVIYIALGLVFCLCLYELMRNADGLFLIAEKLFAKEIEEIKPAGDLFYFYFRKSSTRVLISKNTIIAFFGAIITSIVTIILTVIILVARKIKDNRAIEEELLYQRFKERMEREKRR